MDVRWVIVIAVIIGTMFMFACQVTANNTCKDDCESFGLELFKASIGGFASSECWCREENGTKQIW